VLGAVVAVLGLVTVIAIRARHASPTAASTSIDPSALSATPPPPTDPATDPAQTGEVPSSEPAPSESVAAASASGLRPKPRPQVRKTADDGDMFKRRK
jgi:predicted lipid-binding transport protein (Tim44 family)